MREPVRHSLVAVDALRGIAAFAVVLGHTRAQVLLAQGQPEQGSGMQKLLLAPTGFAAEAVAIFFVISGYLVGGQVVRTVRSERFGWRSYAIRRLSRLYVVLIPALIFTALVDLGIRTFLESGPATVRADHAPPLSEVVCNLAFLQDARCEAMGSNGSLWSLSYEFWFYVVFAAFACAVAGSMRKSPLRALINVIVLVGVVAMFGPHLLALIPAWLIGVGLSLWQDRAGKDTPVGLPAIVAAVLLVLVASVLSTLLDVPEWSRFIIVGVASIAPVAVATRPSALWETRWVGRLAFVGTWSFTMYAFHRPMVAAIAAAVGDETSLSRGVTVVLIYALSIAIAALCYPFYFVGERHTGRVREILLTRFVERRRVSAAGVE